MNNAFFDERLKKLSAIALSTLILFLVVESVAALADIRIKKDSFMPTNVISAAGVGEAVGTPDVATFSFTIRENGKDVAVAQQSMTAKANKAIDYLKKQGITEKDIKTESYYTNPTYQYSNSICTAYGCPPSKQTLTGYEVSETVSVKVRDLSKAGDLLTGIAGLQIGEVSSLSFTMDDPDKLKADAKKQAIENARADAERTASALGVRLGKVISFYEDSASPYYNYGEGDISLSALKFQASDVAPAPIQPGEQKTSVSVVVTYSIR